MKTIITVIIILMLLIALYIDYKQSKIDAIKRDKELKRYCKLRLEARETAEYILEWRNVLGRDFVTM